MADSSSTQDEELYLPRTVINKLIKEMVPNIRVSTDARDLILNCCSEFIHLLASEASEISEKQQKKVISPEHVVDALQTLGFHEYIDEVKQVYKEYKEQAISEQLTQTSSQPTVDIIEMLLMYGTIRLHSNPVNRFKKHRQRGKSRLDRLGVPEEELLRQQQQLFEQARLENELHEQQQALLESQMGTTSAAIQQLNPSQELSSTQDSMQTGEISLLPQTLSLSHDKQHNI